MSKLHTENPQHLLYQQDFLHITVLGGIRLDGLDRMRVTLKMEVEHLTLRHNLDLYNDTQVEKLVRKAAAKLELGTSILAAALEELTSELESYRLEQIEQQEKQNSYQPHPLTAQQQQQATEFLSAPNLLERTNELIGKSGVIGEEINRLIMLLIFTSRKRSHPLHVVSLGASGTGKTHLQEKVAELIPQEDKIELTSLSENAFYYFERNQLSHKLLLIEDLDGADSALYPLRELQSKKRISKTIVHKNTRGETRSVHLQVEGPVCVAGCTTQESIYEDNANRSFLLYLDESPLQDERIMDYQRAQSAGKINFMEELKVKELLQNTQRLLQPLKVINPFAQALQLPKEVFKPRRTNTHYLQFIEAVTFYHQKQREVKTNTQTGEIYIETTLQDIQQANNLLKGVLLRKSDNLSGACRNYFEKLKQFLQENQLQSFTNRQISLQLRSSIATVKRHHLDLYNSGHIRIAKKDKLKGYEYEVASYKEYSQLQSTIASVLDETFERLTSSLPAQSHNEPLNSQKTNTKTQTDQVSKKRQPK